jgi:hypothetical protein
VHCHSSTPQKIRTTRPSCLPLMLLQTLLPSSRTSPNRVLHRPRLHPQSPTRTVCPRLVASRCQRAVPRTRLQHHLNIRLPPAPPLPSSLRPVLVFPSSLNPRWRQRSTMPLGSHWCRYGCRWTRKQCSAFGPGLFFVANMWDVCDLLFFFPFCVLISCPVWLCG